MDEALVSTLQQHAAQVRRSILEMAGSTDGSHAVCALSEVEIVVTLFGAVLRHRPLPAGKLLVSPPLQTARPLA